MTAGDDEWTILDWARRASFVPTHDTVYADLGSVGWGAQVLVGLVAKAVVDIASSPVEINFEQRLVRSGNHSLEFDKITRAHLDDAFPHVREFRFHGENDLGFAVLLAEGDRPRLTASTRDLLIRMIGSTRIEMPNDRFDPRGRFAKINFPTHLTAKEAAALLTNSPVVATSPPLMG